MKPAKEKKRKKKKNDDETVIMIPLDLLTIHSI